GGRLADIADQIARDDTLDNFAALSADIAADRGDRRLAAWCLPHLDDAGDGTVMVGIGTGVLGFAHHFAGQALLALGELKAATARLSLASALASERGATLWWAHSQVALARVFVESDAADGAAATVERVRSTGLQFQSPRLARLMGEVRGRPRRAGSSNR
ncbi:MAG: hypothetical protein ACKPDI_12615, partial [Actinomycetota bacterium]